MAKEVEAPTGEVEETPETEATGEVEETEVETPKNVPLGKFEKERKARQKAEKALETASKKEAEEKKSKMDEVDRLKLELEEERNKASAAEAARVITERQSIARLEASKLGAIDADDVLPFLNLNELEDRDEIVEALGEFKERKAHFFGELKAPATTPPGGGPQTPANEAVDASDPTSRKAALLKGMMDELHGT